MTNQVFVLGNLKERLPFFANSQKVSSLQVQSVMLFAPIGGLAASLLRSDQVENLYTDNVELIIDLGNGAPISERLQQYEASDLTEELTGFWALQVNEPLPLTADLLKDAWLVIKYQFAVPQP